MEKEDFDGILAGLDDAIAYAAGGTSRGRVAAPIDVKMRHSGALDDHVKGAGDKSINLARK